MVDVRGTAITSADGVDRESVVDGRRLDRQDGEGEHRGALDSPGRQDDDGCRATVAGDRTVAFEFLRIEQRPDAIVYIAQPGGRPPTEFRLTASTPTSATFENPQHDNPKLIRYSKEGEGTLIAEIEGDEKGKRVSQRFVFKRGA